MTNILVEMWGYMNIPCLLYQCTVRPIHLAICFASIYLTKKIKSKLREGGEGTGERE